MSIPLSSGQTRKLNDTNLLLEGIRATIFQASSFPPIRDFLQRVTSPNTKKYNIRASSPRGPSVTDATSSFCPIPAKDIQLNRGKKDLQR